MVLQSKMDPAGSSAALAGQSPVAAGAGSLVTLVLAWLAVGLPLLWGVLQTLEKTLALFK